MNRILRVGVIGLGHQSLEDHIPAIDSCIDTQLVAVAEVEQQKLSDFLSTQEGVHGYTDAMEMIEKEHLDFVIIAVPHHLHHELTKQALQRGLHVLKEKPFATSLSDAQELLALAKKYNRHLIVTLQRRFNPIYNTFFQLVDKIGELYFLEAQYTFFTSQPDAGWRGSKDLAGGGCLLDMGYHIVDLLIWYFGLPDRVIACASTRAVENAIYTAEDTAQLLFSYDTNRLWGSLLLSRSIPPKQEHLHLYGTRGSIHLERGKIERRQPDGSTIESLTREYHWPSAAQDQIEYFVRLIRGKKNSLDQTKTHLQHIAFIQAAYLSLEQQKFIYPNTLL